MLQILEGLLAVVECALATIGSLIIRTLRAIAGVVMWYLLRLGGGGYMVPPPWRVR